MSYIEVDDVNLIYGDHSNSSLGSGTLALQGVGLQVEHGDFVSIAGPSGCGKSTLLKIVAGLTKPTSGRVWVAGALVNGPLKIVGMAFQNATLLPWRNIRSNVLLPLEIVQPYRSRFHRDKARHIEMAEELLALVGLQGFEDRAPWQLSGGMQQRAQLCRALIHQPDILLLDEPFAALDPFTREELWGVLQTLYERRKCTVILVTHELREAVYLSDTVHVMSPRPGRVVTSKRTMLKRPRTLEDTFSSEFTDLVHELRQCIKLAHSET